MADQAYQFSRWIYNIMESFFSWVWSLVTSGRLDFFFRHWFMIALLVSAAAFTIDMLLYFLREGKETLAVKAVLFVYGFFRRLYFKITGKEMPAEYGENGDEPDTSYQQGFYMDAPAFEPDTFEYERSVPAKGAPGTITKEDVPPLEEAPGKEINISYIFPEIMQDEDELTTDKRPDEGPPSNVREFPAVQSPEETETPTDEK